MIAPSFVMTAFSANSLGAGLAIVLVIFVVVQILRSLIFVRQTTPNQSASSHHFPVSLLLGIMVHGIMARSALPSEFDLERFALSYIFLAFMLSAAALLVSRIKRTASNCQVAAAVRVVLLLLVVNAALGLTGIHFLPGATSKPVGLFSEPSHLALVLAPLLVYLCVTGAKHSGRYLLGFLFWGLVIENLTMVLTVAFAFAVTAEYTAKRLAVAVGLLMLFVAADIQYFADRLFISEENNNLSVLVFLQGWQNAFLLLDHSNGVGGGFQQFGLIGEFGDLTERVTEANGFPLNMYDGGSTASKLIGEFGYAGFFLIAAYVYAFARCVIALRHRSAHPRLTSFDYLTLAFFISYALEIGVRGVGYFSPGTFLFLVATINLQGKGVFFPRKNEKKDFRRFSSKSNVRRPA
jgi:hypothetical protein